MFSIATYDWPAKDGLTPFEHQKQTVDFLLRNKRAFVLNEMGTGKTLSVLWAIDILLRAAKIKRILIVCPLSTMRSVWTREIFFNFPNRKVEIAHGPRDVRLKAIHGNAEIVVINHDGVKNYLDDLVKAKFDIIVIDELTAFKTHNSARTEAMLQLANRTKAVWGLTGEPTPNSPIEAYAQCKVVNPTWPNLPRYYGQFRDATMYQVNEYLWLPKPEAPHIVASCMQPSIRFTRDQCFDLPDTTYLRQEIEFTKEQADAYKRMKEYCMIQYEQGNITASSAAIVLNKLLQISAGAVKNDSGEIVEIGCEPRIQATIELFQNTPQKKLVIFATYIATIKMLERKLSAAGIKCATIFGEVDQKTRASRIADFQDGDLQVLIMQPQSSAHGITLVASSNILWFSLIPSNELYQQGNARIVRPGQKLKTFIWHFISSKAEEHIANILERKSNMSEEVLALFKSSQI